LFVSSNSKLGYLHAAGMQHPMMRGNRAVTRFPFWTGSVRIQLLTQSLHVAANNGPHYRKGRSNRNHHVTLATDLHDSLR